MDLQRLLDHLLRLRRALSLGPNFLGLVRFEALLVGLVALSNTGGTLRHVDRELRARPAILRHDADQSGSVIDGERDVLAVVAERRRLAERSDCARIRIEDVAQIAGVIVPGALEPVDPAAEKPFDHRSSPAFASWRAATDPPERPVPPSRWPRRPIRESRPSGGGVSIVSCL